MCQGPSTNIPAPGRHCVWAAITAVPLSSTKPKLSLATRASHLPENLLVSWTGPQAPGGSNGHSARRSAGRLAVLKQYRMATTLSRLPQHRGNSEQPGIARLVRAEDLPPAKHSFGDGCWDPAHSPRKWYSVNRRSDHRSPFAPRRLRTQKLSGRQQPAKIPFAVICTTAVEG